LKNALLRRTLDNVTVVMISFANFKHLTFDTKASPQKLENDLDFKEFKGKKENIPPPMST
jgi:hypothetical protein